jgi:hypothetical protein
MKLLFLCAKWHGFAKLRMHTDVTLKLFENLTTELGDQFRLFVAETCTQVKAYELEREARAREKAASKSKDAAPPPAEPLASVPADKSQDRQRPSACNEDHQSGGALWRTIAPPRPTSEVPPTTQDHEAQSIRHPGSGCNEDHQSGGVRWRTTIASPSSSSREVPVTTQDHETQNRPPIVKSQIRKLPKKMNLSTPKFHALGHYYRCIRLFGTTDSYSTELVWFIHHFSTPLLILTAG